MVRDAQTSQSTFVATLRTEKARPMTILPHTVSKFLHYHVTAAAMPSQLIDSAACKAMKMHAEIEVARRFWACPFQSLHISIRAPEELEFHSADANVVAGRPARR
jgi:hypothetical protein